jgi:hypothetical protein
MLPKSVTRLVAAAGRASAEERRRGEKVRMRQERGRLLTAKAKARAEENAQAVWTWLLSPTAQQLRSAMRQHGLAWVRLGWALGLVRGEWRRGARGFGSVRVEMAAVGPALRISTVHGTLGGSSRVADSAETLADLVPARALTTFAREIRRGRGMRLVQQGLATLA